MSTHREIILTHMSPERGAEFDEMIEEYRASGDIGVYRGHFAVAPQGYAAFFPLVLAMKSGGHPTPDIVPMDSYFIESEGRILGEIYIRHRLTPHLEIIGGHIGYKVRPAQRNQGVATTALKLALHRASQMGLLRALVTCNDTNIPSAKVIEKCGGVRIENSETEYGIERRYWVPTDTASK